MSKNVVKYWNVYLNFKLPAQCFLNYTLKNVFLGTIYDNSLADNFRYQTSLLTRHQFMNIGLQFLARGLSISHEIHPEPYKFRCFKKNYSV